MKIFDGAVTVIGMAVEQDHIFTGTAYIFVVDEHGMKDIAVLPFYLIFNLIVGIEIHPESACFIGFNLSFKGNPVGF